MEAKELRITNLVLLDGNIIEIGITHLMNFSFWERNEQELHPTRWEPIPLTEEWLLKFGFVKELDSFYRKNKSSMIEVCFYDNGSIVASQSVCLSYIKYVHNIQNLYFALTGEELTL